MKNAARQRLQDEAGLMTSVSITRNRLAMAALLLGGVAIGGSPIFIRLSEVGPMATAFWRVFLALLPLFLLSRANGQPDGDAPPASLRDYALLMLPGAFLAADLVGWHLSVTMTSVANSTLLVNLTPIFVTLGSWILFRARVTALFLTGLAMAIVGVVVLKGGPAAVGGGNIAGDGLAIVAAVFYAGYMISLGRLRNRFATSRIMIWTTLSASIWILPVAFFWEGDIVPVTAYGWAIVIALALISQTAGQWLIVYALAYLPTSFSSLTLLLQPVVAALLAWTILGEPIGLMQGVGGVIVLAGILVARRG